MAARAPVTSTSLLRPLLRPTCPSPLAAAFPAASRSYAMMKKKKEPRKRPTKTHFTPVDLSQVQQFSLLEAVRYIRAFEVGRDPVSTKYEIHVKLRTSKSGPTIKSRIRLPTPVKTDMRICVIAEGEHAEAAKAAGAVLVGTEDVFEEIRNGNLEFDKVICHDDCFQALAKAKLGRILGPKGMMPSQKFGTVVPNVAVAMRDLVGKSDFRERQGVIRMAIGQLKFSEAQLAANIKSFLEQIKKEMAVMAFRADKSINEVVLSSTNSAGFSLSGDIREVRKEVPVAPAATA